MRSAAIIVAAGRGERLRSDVPKAFVELAGEPLLAHVLRRFLLSEAVEEIAVVVPPTHVDRCEGLLSGPPSVRLRAVAGGERRQDSVRLGLESLSDGIDLVAVHDAARPLISPDLIRRTLEAARAHGAAIAAVPVADTVKEVGGEGRIVATRSRQGLWLAQTPQCFHAKILREACRRAASEKFAATDDASLVERLGLPVHVVAGDPSNLKITRPEDLGLAAAWLALQ